MSGWWRWWQQSINFKVSTLRCKLHGLAPDNFLHILITVLRYFVTLRGEFRRIAPGPLANSPALSSAIIDHRCKIWPTLPVIKIMKMLSGWRQDENKGVIMDTQLGDYADVFTFYCVWLWAVVGCCAAGAFPLFSSLECTISCNLGKLITRKLLFDSWVERPVHRWGLFKT
jgi:hypothetical protein